MTPEYNYPHTQIECPECKQQDAVYDSFHDETYCTQCGTVLITNTLPRITITEAQEEKKVKFIRNLWKKNKR